MISKDRSLVAAYFQKPEAFSGNLTFAEAVYLAVDGKTFRAEPIVLELISLFKVRDLDDVEVNSSTMAAAVEKLSAP
jgi:hypothetical protein